MQSKSGYTENKNISTVHGKLQLLVDSKIEIFGTAVEKCLWKFRNGRDGMGMAH